jgi:energy-coupling factor transporter ATP-binding protein EcfA2
MTAAAQAGEPTAPFASMPDLQRDHLQLSDEAEALERHGMDAAGPAAEDALRQIVMLRRRIRRFERRAAATGAVLDEGADRAVAQRMLDYWCLRQAYLQRQCDQLRQAVGSERARQLLTSAPRLRDPMRLVPFDEASAPQLPDFPSPFVGLNAFGEAEAAQTLYFGREEAVGQLKAALSGNRLVIVAGPSGSGKSSLVMAGLIPALRHNALEGSSDWIYRPAVLPGADPFAALLQALRPAGQTTSWIAANRAALEKAPEGITALLADQDKPDQPSLLVFDQVEELLSMVSSPEVQTRFAATMVAASQGDGPQHRVILIVREDFLERLFKLEAFAGLTEASVTRFQPKPMTSAELRLAIEEPARSIGLKFDDGIVDDLVREVVNDPAALPLLQFTLTQLWQKRRRNRITLEAYTEVGRPAEALGRTAERVFEGLNTPQNKAAAKDIFLALVVPSIGAEFVRRRVRREALHTLRDSGQIDRVLEAFEKAGLIRKIEGVEAADDRFDVMHEALLRNWQRLMGWLDEKLRTSGRQLQVLNRARIWDESGRENDHLAIGSAVAEAGLFAADDALIREYFEASQRYAEKRTRQRRIVIAVAVLAAFLSLGAVIWAIMTYNLHSQLTAEQGNTAEANRQAEEARGQAVAARESSEVQRASQQALFNESIAAGLPSLRLNQPLPSLRADGPRLSGAIWVGTAESPLIGDPQSMARVSPSLIRAGQRYRLRANLALRADYPNESPFFLAPPLFPDGTVAAGSLVVALDQARGYDRPARQYWLRVRLVPRVIVRYSNESENRAAIVGIVAALRNAGYDAAAADPIPATESQSELRYFYAQDRDVANGLVARLRSIPGSQHLTVPTVSKIQSAVRPDPGTLELWLDPSVPGPAPEPEH